MITPAILVALYPPPIRERWGDDLAREIARSGPRAWLDTAAGAVALWAHPADWPESAAGQTRRVLIVEIAAVAAVAALLLRATGRPSPTFPADFTRPATSAWLAAIVIGLAVATPLPPLRWRALRRLTALCLRSLVSPAAALLTMYVLAHSGLIGHPAGAIHTLLRVYYWMTVTFVAVRLCALAGQIGHLVVAPSVRRLRTANLLIGIGLVLAAAQNLASGGLHREPAIGVAVPSIALAAIAALALVTAHDLRRVPRSAKASSPPRSAA